MPDDGPRELEGDGTEANSATRVGPKGWPSGPLPVPGPRLRPAAPAHERPPADERPPAARRPRARRYLAPWVIAGLVFVEESGIPVPFAPGDLLLVIAGIAIASDTVEPVPMVAASTARRSCRRCSAASRAGS